MAKLSWNAAGERYFEAGVDRGVLYPKDGPGVPWNGLINVSESPEGSSTTAYYYDGVKYHSEVSPSDYSGSIEAYTYPDEFSACDGTIVEGGLSFTNQPRKSFGFSYRTLIGNDSKSTDHGYKIHLIYNAMVSPNELSRDTISDSPEAMTFNWEISAVPVTIPGKRSTAHLIINSTKVDPNGLIEIEDILYGRSDRAPRMPTPEELMLFAKLPFWKVNEGSDVYHVTPDGRDLVGMESIGIYSAPPSSRIVDSDSDGIYDWRG